MSDFGKDWKEYLASSTGSWFSEHFTGYKTQPEIEAWARDNSPAVGNWLAGREARESRSSGGKADKKPYGILTAIEQRVRNNSRAKSEDIWDSFLVSTDEEEELTGVNDNEQFLTREPGGVRGSFLPLRWVPNDPSWWAANRIVSY